MASGPKSFGDQLESWETLAQLTRKRIRKQIEKATKVAGTAGDQSAFVLVLDEFTQPIVSAVIGRYELVEMGCASVVRLDIEGSRSPQAALDAVYFVNPTDDNLQRICDDFAIRSEVVHNCMCDCGPQHSTTYQMKAFMYNEVHVFTVDKLTPEKLDILKASPGLRGQLKTLKQLSLNYSAIEDNVFTFNMHNDLQTLFECAPVSVQNKSQDMIVDIAKRLVTLCVTLDEKPLVRYCAASPVCERIAQQFNSEMQAFVTEFGWDRERNRNGFHPKRGWKAVELAGTVLIVDRVQDLIAPILHDFGYQCIVQDLLDIKDGRVYSYENSKGKTQKRLLNNTDNLFTQIKYDHLGKAVDTIVKSAKELDGNNKSSGGEPSLEDLQNRLRSFADQSKAAAEVQDHTTMVQQVFATVKEKNIKELVRLEQIFATNMEQNGSDYTYHKVRDGLRQFLSSSELSPIDKARLLVLFQATAKHADTRKYLRDLAKIANFHNESHLFKALLNQQKLYTNPPVSAIHVNGKVDPRLQNQMKARSKAAKDDMRYEPKIKSVVEQHIKGTLDPDLFPYLGAPAMAGFEDRENLFGPRVIVFVAGGASYSEMRALNQVLRLQIDAVKNALKAEAQFTSGGSTEIRASKIETVREVILGSTSIVAPEVYVSKLSTADRHEEVTGQMLFDVLEYERSNGVEGGGAGK